METKTPRERKKERERIIKAMKEEYAVFTGSNSSFAVIKEEDGETETVYGWGWNRYGEVGAGVRDMFLGPTKISFLDKKPVSLIGCGGQFTIFVLENNTAFGVGFNRGGQLGIGTFVVEHAKIPVEIETFRGKKIHQIVCAYDYSLAILSADRSVWSWGKNKHGQLGLGTIAKKNTPQQITSIAKKVKYVDTGCGHSVALLEDNTVCSWGYNLHGQLGLDTINDKTYPILITSLVDVKQIACGDFHTMAILNNGTTWGWGCSTMNHFPMKLEEIRKYSYNGDGTSAISRIIHPIEIEILKGIESIIVGSSFSIGIFSKDRVCIWGENLKQFGLPSYGELAFLRSEDPLLNFIPSMKHGHSHFLSVLDGNIYSWGDNIVGQLGYGSGDHKDYIFPAIMPKLEAFKIALSRAPTDILI